MKTFTATIDQLCPRARRILKATPHVWVKFIDGTEANYDSETGVVEYRDIVKETYQGGAQ